MKIYKRSNSLISVLFIYLISLYVVVLLCPCFTMSKSMLDVFIADIVWTLLIFMFSFLFKNSSIYDPYWSVVPPLIVIYLMNVFPDGNLLRQSMVLLLVLFWSIRLTLNWARGWQGLNHQDWRYSQLADKTGKSYWLVSLFGIHLMPTLLVFLGSLTFWYTLSSESPLNFIDGLAFSITFVAIIIEWQADEQLKRFKKIKSSKNYIDTGLWSKSRHPNYLGEILFWFGLFVFVVAAGYNQDFLGWWTGVGFIAMFILFRFISIPMMEKRNLSNKQNYNDYIKRVPMLFPKVLNKNK